MCGVYVCLMFTVSNACSFYLRQFPSAVVSEITLLFHHELGNSVRGSLAQEKALLW